MVDAVAVASQEEGVPIRVVDDDVADWASIGFVEDGGGRLDLVAVHMAAQVEGVD